MSSEPRKKRGRPPLLTTEQIVATSMQLLSDAPLEDFTMQRVSKQLNVAPMTLYGYFSSREGLLQAIVADVFARLDTREARTASNWQDQLRLWCTLVRSHLRALPQMLRLVTNPVHLTAAWLDASEPLVDALEQAGLDRAGVAHFGRWISRSLIGVIVVENVFDETMFAPGLPHDAHMLDPLSSTQRSHGDALGSAGTADIEDHMFRRTLESFVTTVQSAVRTPAATLASDVPSGRAVLLAAIVV